MISWKREKAYTKRKKISKNKIKRVSSIRKKKLIDFWQVLRYINYKLINEYKSIYCKNYIIISEKSYTIILSKMYKKCLDLGIR